MPEPGSLSNSTVKWSVAAACIGSVTSAALTYYVLSQKQAAEAAQIEVPQESRGSSSTDVAPASAVAGKKDIFLDEQLSRCAVFFGPEGQACIQDSCVLVVGVGGVGSHAACMLARSGIQKLRLVDFDQVTLSSLNRHAVATREDVGTFKVTSVEKHLKEIIPFCQVESMPIRFDTETIETILADRPAFVLDCIDDVNTKVLLLKECHKRGLKVVSCFGAGAKNDPTRIQIGDIGDAIKDPLASKVRWLMKQGEDPIPLKSSGDYGITAVFSCQKPVCDLLSLSDSQADNPEEYGAIENTRLRLIPVLGALPAIFGLSMASHVLCQLGKKDFVPQSTERLSRDLRNKFYQRLVKRHNGVYNSEARMMVDKSDIDTLVSEVWKERSAVTGKRMGGQCQAMALCRWDRAQPTAPDNLVLLTAKEADKCDEEGPRAFGEEVFNRVNDVLRNRAGRFEFTQGHDV